MENLKGIGHTGNLDVGRRVWTGLSWLGIRSIDRLL
jgi:hypothetical protein